jgi:hypothetical protein
VRNGPCFGFANWKIKKWKRYVNTICAMANSGKRVFAQFTNAQSIHLEAFTSKKRMVTTKKVESGIGPLRSYA